MHASRLKTILRRRLRRGDAVCGSSWPWIVLLAMAIALATLYVACEAPAFGASRLGGARLVGDVEDFQRDAAAIEPFAFAQEQQSIARELPTRASSFAGDVQERTDGMALPIDFVELDLVDVGLLASDGVGVDAGQIEDQLRREFYPARPEQQSAHADHHRAEIGHSIFHSR